MSKIDEAIDRLSNGSFGICEECGEEIDIERLNIRPVTTFCIRCKETLEAQENKKLICLHTPADKSSLIQQKKGGTILERPA